MHRVTVVATAVRVILAGAACAAVAPHAGAQVQAPSTSARSLEEIVVTARKREEVLKDVPIAVTAIGSERISDLGLASVEDIARFTPGFSYTAGFGRNSLERPVIRGQSNILGEPNASFFVDGVYVNGPGVSTEIASLERVEIIKGPQSALFGRATFAGAINYVTRKPTSEVEAEFRATAAEHDEYELGGWISGPIIDDRLLYFVAARQWTYGGEWKNEFDGETIGAQETSSVAAKLLWNVTDDFEATLLASYAEDDDNHMVLALQGRQYNNCQPRGTQFPRSRGYYCGTALDVADLPIRMKTDLFPDGGGLKRDRFRAALTLDWNLSEWTVTSVTSYSEEDQDTETDVSYAGYDAFIALGAANAGSFWRLEAEDRDDFSEELRLSSPGDRALRMSGGVYYWKGNNDRTRNDKVLPSGRIVPNGAADLNDKETVNTAVFAGLEWDISDTWTFTLEGRYGEDEITQVNYAIPAGGTAHVETSTQQATFDNFLPRATLSWKLNPDVTVYANYAEGAKPGTFNTGLVLSIPGIPEAVEEEESRNYELGAKMILMDGKASVNLALYYIDLFNQQLTNTAFTVNPVTGAAVANSYIENIGETTSQGIEVEVNLQLSARWDAQLGYSVNNSEIQEYLNQDQADMYSSRPATAFRPPVCSNTVSPTCAERAQADLEEFGDVAGNVPPRAPLHQGFAATRYQFPLSNGMTAYAGADYTYESSKYSQVHNLIKTGNRGYLGARLGLKGLNWDVALWGKNLADDTTTTDIVRYIDMQGITTLGQYLANGAYIPRGFALTAPRGRQVGMTGTLRF